MNSNKDVSLHKKTLIQLKKLPKINNKNKNNNNKNKTIIKTTTIIKKSKQKIIHHFIP